MSRPCDYCGQWLEPRDGVARSGKYFCVLSPDCFIRWIVRARFELLLAKARSGNISAIDAIDVLIALARPPPNSGASATVKMHRNEALLRSRLFGGSTFVSLAKEHSITSGRASAIVAYCVSRLLDVNIETIKAQTPWPRTVIEYFAELPEWMAVSLDTIEEKTGDVVPPHTAEASP